MQNLAAPVQLAPNVVRPKSSTVSATRKPFAQLAENVFLRHEHVVERQPCGRRAANAALGHPFLDHFEARHVGRHQERRDLGFLAPRHRSAGHHGQRMGDARRW